MVRFIISITMLLFLVEGALCFEITSLGEKKFILNSNKEHENKYIQIKTKENNVLIIERNRESIKFELSGYLNKKIAFEIMSYDNGFQQRNINLTLNTVKSKNVLKRKDVQILVEISKQKVPFGDGVLIKYSLLSDYQYVNYRVSKFPSYEGFIKRFVDPGNNTRPLTFEGQLKYITPLYHVELFPLHEKRQVVNNMEIIVDESTSREFLLISEDPKFIFYEDKSFDQFKNITISPFKDIQISNKRELKKELLFTVSGMGLVENINDIKFKGDAIKSFSLRLYDQKYRPGFGEKSYKVFLDLLPFKNGKIDVYIEGRKVADFFVDTFLSSSGRKNVTHNSKFITNSSFLILLDSLIILSFFAIISFFLLGNKMTMRIIIFNKLFKLYIKGKIPFKNFNDLNSTLFPYSDINWYFLENFIAKYSGQNDRNIPKHVFDTHNKIIAMLENYRKKNQQLHDNDVGSHSLSFFELFRYLIFLQKELRWK